MLGRRFVFAASRVAGLGGWLTCASCGGEATIDRSDVTVAVINVEVVTACAPGPFSLSVMFDVELCSGVENTERDVVLTQFQISGGDPSGSLAWTSPFGVHSEPVELPGRGKCATRNFWILAGWDSGTPPCELCGATITLDATFVLSSGAPLRASSSGGLECDH